MENSIVVADREFLVRDSVFFHNFLRCLRGFLETGMVKFTQNQQKKQQTADYFVNREESNMKKRAKNLILVAGILCVMSIMVCACGGTGDESPDAVVTAPVKQQAETENIVPGREEAVQELTEETDSTSGKWEDSGTGLEGSIKEIQDGQLTVVEAVTEESDDGGAIMIVPGSSDDSDFNKVTVTYDENTMIEIQTIKGGGASYDMSEATADSLAEGQSVRVWGIASEDGLKAERIWIILVE